MERLENLERMERMERLEKMQARMERMPISNCGRTASRWARRVLDESESLIAEHAMKTRKTRPHRRSKDLHMTVATASKTVHKQSGGTCYAPQRKTVMLRSDGTAGGKIEGNDRKKQTC